MFRTPEIRVEEFDGTVGKDGAEAAGAEANAPAKNEGGTAGGTAGGTVGAFNEWARNPESAALPDGFYYLAFDGQPRIRVRQELKESPTETKWITNRESPKYLLPNPRLFNQMTNIGELYKMDAGQLKSKGNNGITITEPAAMTDNGFVNLPGKLDVKPAGNSGENARLYSLESADNEGMKEEQARLKSVIVNQAVKREPMPYSLKNYKKLFPNNKAITPIEEVHLRGDQFLKLQKKGREKLLGTMYQTLTDPVIVIRKGNTDYYVKSFLPDKTNSVFIVVRKRKKGGKEAVTTHLRPVNNIINKIEKKTDVLYEKDIGYKTDVEGDAPHPASGTNPNVNSSGSQSERFPLGSGNPDTSLSAPSPEKSSGGVTALNEDEGGVAYDRPASWKPSAGRRARGAFGFDRDGNAVMRLSSRADVQTYIHEKIHALAATLTDAQLGEWDGLNTGIDLRTRAGQEAFVDLMLYHVRTRKATGSPPFDRIVARVRQFILDIRRALAGADALTPEVAAYLDGLLFRGDAPAWNRYFDRARQEARVKAEADAARLTERAEAIIGEAGAEMAEDAELPPPQTEALGRMRKAWQAARKVSGDYDEAQIGGHVIPGRWQLVEADAPMASHDETTFQKTPDYPETADGKTINDRDYEKDKSAQKRVVEDAQSYDERAAGVDKPVIVTQDGVVISGNQRTMSGKRAARDGTDGAYLAALKKRAGKFGFRAADIETFSHPSVIFETVVPGPYTTALYAEFNVRDEKTQTPLKTTVKASKMLAETPRTVKRLAAEIEKFETLGDLYATTDACRRVFDILLEEKLIGRNDLNL